MVPSARSHSGETPTKKPPPKLRIRWLLSRATGITGVTVPLRLPVGFRLKVLTIVFRV